MNEYFENLSLTPGFDCFIDGGGRDNGFVAQ